MNEKEYGTFFILSSSEPSAISWRSLSNSRRTLRRLIAPCILCGMSFVASADTIAEKNQVLKPPFVTGTSQSCSLTLAFKPAISEGIDDMHGYLVLTRPDGSKTEIRGGPSHKGSGDLSDAGPVGNPFSCPLTTKWGVVVPYVGPHGKIGKDSSGVDLFSPDGNIRDPKGVTNDIKSFDNKKSCVLANCVMQMMHVAGKSCKSYTLGIGELRNSNTIISFALSACGVANPLPPGITATGWGGSWNKL